MRRARLLLSEEAGLPSEVLIYRDVGGIFYGRKLSTLISNIAK